MKKLKKNQKLNLFNKPNFYWLIVLASFALLIGNTLYYLHKTENSKTIRVMPYVVTRPEVPRFFQHCDFAVTKDGGVKKVQNSKLVDFDATKDSKINNKSVTVCIPVRLDTVSTYVMRNTIFIIDELAKNNKIRKVTCESSEYCDEINGLPI